MPTVPETILFLARSLDGGGAERQLVMLAKALARNGHTVSVAVFYGGGVYANQLADADVRIIDLSKRSRWDVFGFLLRLVRSLRKERPDILHGYMGTPNILSAILKPLLPGTRIVWGVRASNVDLTRYDGLTRLVYAIERRLAKFADCIIANSDAGKRYAVANGFPEDKITVIYNGIDTDYFCFDSEARLKVRSAFGVGQDEILIGLVGRLDPMKDHPVFIEAASKIARERINVRFVCVGDGPADYTRELKEHANAVGLTGQLIWTGARDDMPAVYSALDIASSSSCFGEGFSNTIAEAMACGVPSVVTRVGDSSMIVAGTGIVVPPKSPDALAKGLLGMIDLGNDERRRLGREARQSIVKRFGVIQLAQRTWNRVAYR